MFILTGVVCLNFALLPLGLYWLYVALTSAISIHAILFLQRCVDKRKATPGELAIRDLTWGVVMPVLWMCCDPYALEIEGTGYNGIVKFVGGHVDLALSAYCLIGSQMILLLYLVFVNRGGDRLKAFLAGGCLVCLACIPLLLLAVKEGLIPEFGAELFGFMLLVINAYCFFMRFHTLYKEAAMTLGPDKTQSYVAGGLLCFMCCMAIVGFAVEGLAYLARST